LFGGYAVPPVFVQRVKNSNMKALMEKSDSRIPRTMDQLYEENNPETGEKSLEHIAGTVKPSMNGDTFYVMIGGGAGYGDVLERDPERVIQDLESGMCTHWAATNLYKIAYDEKTLRLDAEKTKILREEARKERIKEGKPFAEFEKEWLKLRPSEATLEYFGTYPHPREGLAASNDDPG
jgi:acetophenone carboxylase